MLPAVGPCHSARAGRTADDLRHLRATRSGKDERRLAPLAHRNSPSSSRGRGHLIHPDPDGSVNTPLGLDGSTGGCTPRNNTDRWRRSSNYKHLTEKQARTKRLGEMEARHKAKEAEKKRAAAEDMKARLAESQRAAAVSEIGLACNYYKLRWRTRKLKGRGILDYFLPPGSHGYEAARLLLLSCKDLCKFRARFDAIDISRDGNIDYTEFLEFIWDKDSSLPPYDTPYVKAIFRLFDKDGSGDIDFGEFVLANVAFGTWSRDDILRFAFNTMDADGSALLDEEEFRMLLDSLTPSSEYSDVYKDSKEKDADGKLLNPVVRGVFPGSLKVMLETYDLNEDGSLDMHEFKALERAYPMILNPLLKVQDLIWRSTLGVDRYIAILTEQQISKQLKEYMQLHKNTFPPPKGCKNALNYKLRGRHHLAKYADKGRVDDPGSSVLKPTSIISKSY